METFTKNIIMMGIFKRTLISPFMQMGISYFKWVYLMNMHKNKNYQGRLKDKFLKIPNTRAKYLLIDISLDCKVAKIKNTNI